jgi:hypothetical protein
MTFFFHLFFSSKIENVYPRSFLCCLWNWPGWTLTGVGEICNTLLPCKDFNCSGLQRLSIAVIWKVRFLHSCAQTIQTKKNILIPHQPVTLVVGSSFSLLVSLHLNKLNPTTSPSFNGFSSLELMSYLLKTTGPLSTPAHSSPSLLPKVIFFCCVDVFEWVTVCKLCELM